MSDVEVRCECSKRPILGIFRRQETYWVLHVKAYKQKRVYVELIVEEGTLRLRCRECDRWFKLTIRREKNQKIPPNAEESSGWPLKDGRSSPYLAEPDASSSCDRP